MLYPDRSSLRKGVLGVTECPITLNALQGTAVARYFLGLALLHDDVAVFYRCYVVGFRIFWIKASFRHHSICRHFRRHYGFASDIRIRIFLSVVQESFTFDSMTQD